jgi:hypothetical protein
MKRKQSENTQREAEGKRRRRGEGGRENPIVRIAEGKEGSHPISEIWTLSRTLSLSETLTG